MTKETELLLLRNCINVVSDSLRDDEAIVQIRKGRTRPGRQVFHFFKVDIATMDPSLGKAPTNRRSLVVSINQDAPDSAKAGPADWEPWDYVYGNWRELREA